MIITTKYDINSTVWFKQRGQIAKPKYGIVRSVHVHICSDGSEEVSYTVQDIETEKEWAFDAKEVFDSAEEIIEAARQYFANIILEMQDSLTDLTGGPSL